MELRVSDETGFFQEKDDCDGVIKVDEILWIIPTEFYVISRSALAWISNTSMIRKSLKKLKVILCSNIFYELSKLVFLRLSRIFPVKASFMKKLFLFAFHFALRCANIMNGRINADCANENFAVLLLTRWRRRDFNWKANFA